MKLLKYILVIVCYEVLTTALNFVTTRSLTVSGVVSPDTELTLFATVLMLVGNITALLAA